MHMVYRPGVKSEKQFGSGLNLNAAVIRSSGNPSSKMASKQVRFLKGTYPNQ